MQFRTDLALEHIEASDFEENGDDISSDVRHINDMTITTIDIINEHGSSKVNRPVGRYITAELLPLSDNDNDMEEKAEVLGEMLRSLLPQSGSVLIVGLGNKNVTPDSLGPSTANMVLATRHIEEEFARSSGLDDLRVTSVFAPGVLGQTGVESSEMVSAVCKAVQPKSVIVIDALASRSLNRLGCTVQMCDTGISPGSGVGNNRKPLNFETLGVPVIGIGMPTVVDAKTIVSELVENIDEEKIAPHGTEMMVTPREIDLIIKRASYLIAMSVNAALHPDYSPASLTAKGQ